MYWTTILLLVFVPLASTVGIWEQCGGEGYAGPTECDAPYQCFRKSRWYSSCQTSCPGTSDWDCTSAANYSAPVEDDTLAPNWGQCGGEGWNGPTACAEFPCEPRSQWFSQCRPDCPYGWMCADIPDEEIDEEDLEELEVYDSEEILEEEETDDFPDPSEVDLDALQQKEMALLGIDEEEDPFAGAEEEEEEESTLRRRRRNTG